MSEFQLGMAVGFALCLAIVGAVLAYIIWDNQRFPSEMKERQDYEQPAPAGDAP